jgi:hypothetical protein
LAPRLIFQPGLKFVMSSQQNFSPVGRAEIRHVIRPLDYKRLY